MSGPLMPLSEFIERLPPLERDILHLHMVLRKTQIDVAKILGVSQPTINYHYKRARERLEFLELLPPISPEEVRTVLRRLGARETDVEAMTLYVETNSQSEVARRMGTSQGAVRHWLHRALVSHLQPDINNEDVHKRVRTACSMLAKKPWIFIEATKPNGARLQSEVRFPKAPKVKGRWVVGERLLVQEGIYAQLEGTVISMEEHSLRLRLDLESQKIQLIWPL